MIHVALFEPEIPPNTGNIIPKPSSHTFFKPTKIPLETVLEILIRSIAMLLGPLNPYMWLYLFNDDRPNDENRAHIRKR